MDFALILDIVFVVIILISAVVAFLRGFVREVLTIVGLVGASLSALAAGPKLSPGLERWLTSDIAADDIADARMWGFIPYDIAASVFAYAGVFVVTLVVLSVISHYIAKSVHAIGLGPIDRSLGVVFGILRGCVLIGLLYMPFHILMDDKDKKDWFGTSHTYAYVESFAETMMGLMPESWTRESGDSDEENAEDSTKEPLDPLKNLTGENDDKSTVEPEDDTGAGYNDMERQAIDVLIENQDRIKTIIDNIPENRKSAPVETE